MESNTRSTLPAALRDLAAMAALLERLDLDPHGSASAHQYRDVARRVSALLVDAPPGPMLDQLLSAAPATAALYENLQYAHAGLVRAPLEAAMDAERAATAAIAKARRR
jgi:hypothetical protein